MWVSILASHTTASIGSSAHSSCSHWSQDAAEAFACLNSSSSLGPVMSGSGGGSAMKMFALYLTRYSTTSRLWSAALPS